MPNQNQDVIISHAVRFLELVSDRQSEFFVELSDNQKITLANKITDVEKFNFSSPFTKDNQFQKEAAVIFGIKKPSGRDEVFEAFLETAKNKALFSDKAVQPEEAYQNCVKAYKQVLGLNNK